MIQQSHEYWPHDLVAGEVINVRPDDADVSELVASIAAHGLLQPLVGRMREDGAVEIIDGNRRLKALKQLFDEGTRQDRVVVMIRDGDSEADAFEVSLAANVLRKPLHPVAEFEAFAALIDKGKSKQEVADHFGITLRAVEQRLALGRLHEDVRKAWRDGRINGEAARAFTIVQPADQAAYLTQANPHWGLRPDEIRRAFTRESVPANRAIARFVGPEAYRAAGGAFIPDLFAAEPDFTDGNLLERLGLEKLTTEAKRIADEEGWGEVLLSSTPEARDAYRWDRLRKPALPEGSEPAELTELDARGQALNTRLEPIDAQLEALYEDEGSDGQEIDRLETERRQIEAEIDEVEKAVAALDLERAAWLSLPAEQRAKAVALVGYDHEGRLEIQRGYLKGKSAPKPAPATALPAPAPKPTANGEEPPEPTRLSAALLDDLALTATRAAAHVLAGHPRIAFAALIASHVAWGAPVRVTSQGRNEGPGMGWPDRDYGSKTDFGEAFRTCVALPDERLQQLAARFVSRCLDFTSKAVINHSSDSLKPAAVQDLRCALPADEHRKALVQAFDAEAFFKAAPKQEALNAIADCGDDPGKHAKLKKGDLTALATRLAGEHGWLPPILRGEIFEATAELHRIDAPEVSEVREPPEPLSESEAHLSVAEAALQIWKDQDEAAGAEVSPDLASLPAVNNVRGAANYADLKLPALRSLLKERGLVAPFGATREKIVEILESYGDRTKVEEAA